MFVAVVFTLMGCALLYCLLLHLTYSESHGLRIAVGVNAEEDRPRWLRDYMLDPKPIVVIGGASSGSEYPISSKPVTALTYPRKLLQWLKREWVLFWVAFVFSLMSTFNIKFREVDFGRWLKLLTTREYDIKAIGLARTISGLQALVSVYFVGLGIVPYFLRPFE